MLAAMSDVSTYIKSQMSGPRLHTVLLLASGFAAYKLCILHAWNGDAMAKRPWVDFQPDCFVLLFCTWGIVTAIALLASLSRFSRMPARERPRLLRRLLNPAFALGLGGILAFLSLLRVNSPFAAIIIAASALSFGCALLHFGWLAIVMRTATFPLAGALTVGQLVTSTMFLLIKQMNAGVQAGCLVASCIVLFASTRALATKLDDEPSLTFSTVLITRSESVIANPFVAGIAVSTLGVGILWGSSSSIRDYTLWVFGALAVCLAFFATSLAQGKEARPEALVRAAFALLGIAILFTAIAPDLHAIFMGVVWVGYSILSLCLFLLGRSRIDPAGRTQVDGRLLVTALAFFDGSVATGLAVGRITSIAAPDVEAPTAVAVALLLAFIFLFGNRAFAYPRTSDKNDPAPTSSGDIGDINDAIRDQCLAFGRLHNLTEAECETLFYLAKGFTISRIAEKRIVSKNTIKSQITSIYRKVGVHSKQGLLDALERNPSHM